MSSVKDTPLEEINVARAELYGDDTWRPWFARLRQEAPVHLLKESAFGPYWSVTSHQLIKEVDTNHEVFSSTPGVGIVDDPVMDDQEGIKIQSFIKLDPPEHGPQRAAVAPSVSPQNLANLEPLIRERVIDILENLPVGETFDWVDRVSMELTCRMLATLFGFPYEERRKLAYWSDLMTAIPEITGDDTIDMAAREAEVMQAAAAFMQLWQERAGSAPQFDLISMLAHGEATRDMISKPELFLGTMMLLIIGGNDTTRNSISGGIIALNQYPDEYDKLRQNASLIPNMVAEIIRWQTPVIHMRRTALDDYELGGQAIRKGDKVVMWYLSGNRDESVFELADDFLIDRANARQHVSFGYGIHRCMGNRLAEMQLRVLWEEIHKRFHKIEIAGDVERASNMFIRGIGRLPVRVIPL